MDLREILNGLRSGRKNSAVDLRIISAAIAELDKRFDFEKAAATLDEMYEARAYGGGSELCLRPSRQGSYVPERKKLAAFLKHYLQAEGKSHLWSRSLLDDFRAFILADCEPLGDATLKQ